MIRQAAKTAAFPRFLGATAGLAIGMSASLARADGPIVFEGDAPTSGPDHFFLEFAVPPGTEEIQITHQNLTDKNILDFGLDDPNGYRGWGGGTTEPTIIGSHAASRAYVPGPMPAGTWRVIIGKAKIVENPAHYKVEVELRTVATLAPIPRSVYVPPAPRKWGTRYYAGDLHVHCEESTDANATLGQNVALAKQRGLEWFESSDHNTITQLDFLNALHEENPDFLVIPGVEFTTYAGHANAIGATKFIDHKIGQPGVTIAGAADAVRAQGALFSINHPVLDIGDLCIGCAWKQDLDPSKVDGVEIGSLGLSAGARFFSKQALAFWDDILDKGMKVPGLGGSDDHKAGTATGSFPAKIGSPTTLVRATELSTDGILAGIRKGATVVKLDSPDDPMVEFEATLQRGGDAMAFPGDTIGVRSVFLRVTVTKGDGQAVRFVKNGVPSDPVTVSGDPFVYEQEVTPPDLGEDRWRAEVLVDDKPRTVTSHVWMHLDSTGPIASDPPPSATAGCGLAGTGSGSTRTIGFGLATFCLAIARWLKVRRR